MLLFRPVLATSYLYLRTAIWHFYCCGMLMRPRKKVTSTLLVGMLSTVQQERNIVTVYISFMHSQRPSYSLSCLDALSDTWNLNFFLRKDLFPSISHTTVRYLEKFLMLKIWNRLQLITGNMDHLSGRYYDCNRPKELTVCVCVYLSAVPYTVPSVGGNEAALHFNTWLSCYILHSFFRGTDSGYSCSDYSNSSCNFP